VIKEFDSCGNALYYGETRERLEDICKTCRLFFPKSDKCSCNRDTKIPTRFVRKPENCRFYIPVKVKYCDECDREIEVIR